MDKYIYKDLDINFFKHPGTDDVTRIFDVEAVKNSIRNIIAGKPFEKPFDEFYGSGIRRILFSNYSPMTEILIKRMIKEKVELYDPRVIIDSVDVNMSSNKIDRNELDITVYFTIRGIGKQILRLEMERMR